MTLVRVVPKSFQKINEVLAVILEVCLDFVEVHPESV